MTTVNDLLIENGLDPKQADFKDIVKVLDKSEYEAMKLDIKRMRIAIAVYCREELDCNTFKDDNDAINQFCEMYRD